MPDSPETLVRSLFASERSAILCTAHAAEHGWPFGSIVPYAMLDNGDLCVFLSDISEHCKNLLADARATVFVADPSVRDNPQSGARHAMMVRARQPEGEEETAIEAIYFARFPEAKRMRSAHGFKVWLLACHRIRWIAGYGGMGWIEAEQWHGQPAE
jgi:heme iron utilization protein